MRQEVRAAIRRKCSGEVRIRKAQVHGRPKGVLVETDVMSLDAKAPGSSENDVPVPSDAEAPVRIVSPNPARVDRASLETTLRLQAVRSGSATLESRIVQFGVEALALSVSVDLHSCGTTVGLPVQKGFTLQVKELITSYTLKAECP